MPLCWKLKHGRRFIEIRSEETILSSGPTSNQGPFHAKGLTMNCSNPNSNNWQFTPSPPGCSTGESGFLTTISAHQQPRPDSSRTGRRERQHTKLDVKAHVDLMQDNPQTIRLRVGHHDKLQTRGRLVIVQFVVPGPVGDEIVLRSSELPNHVSKGEDGAEDEFGVVFGTQGEGLGSDVREAVELRLLRGGGGGGSGTRDPFFLVDAVRWRVLRVGGRRGEQGRE